MSRLTELFPDVTEMSDDELTQMVRQIRVDRRINKAPKKPKVKRASLKSKDKIREILSGLSPDKIRELIRG